MIVETSNQAGDFKRQMMPLLGLMDELVLENPGRRAALIRVMNASGYIENGQDIVGVVNSEIRLLPEGPELVIHFTFKYEGEVERGQFYVRAEAKNHYALQGDY